MSLSRPRCESQQHDRLVDDLISPAAECGEVQRDSQIMALSKMGLAATPRLSVPSCNLPSTGDGSMIAALSSSSVPSKLSDGQMSATWLASIGSVLMAIASVIPGLLYWAVTFTTITLPTALFTLFSTSLTFTMNFTTLSVILRTYISRFPELNFRRMLIVLAFASMVSWLVRYRVLNMYARLPPEPQRKEPQIDLFPDTQEGDSKPGLANYLDEFLSAIKIFGYRELICFRHKGGFTDNSGSRTACLS